MTLSVLVIDSSLSPTPVSAVMVLVAETVIVGDVPDTYTQFDSGNAAEDDAYEYAINNG